jgi:hypothetical protein
MLLRKTLLVTMDGNVKRFTATSIKTPSFVLRNVSDEDILVQHAAEDLAAPGDITADSASYSLAPAQIERESAYDSVGRDHFDLSNLYAKGTSGKKLKVDYLIHV